MTTKRKATTAKKASPKTNASKADAERLEAYKRRLLALGAAFGFIEMRLNRAEMVMNALLFTMQEHKDQAEAEGVCTCQLDEYIANVDLAVEYIEKTSEMAHFRAQDILKTEVLKG